MQTKTVALEIGTSSNLFSMAHAMIEVLLFFSGALSSLEALCDISRTTPRDSFWEK